MHDVLSFSTTYSVHFILPLKWRWNLLLLCRVCYHIETLWYIEWGFKCHHHMCQLKPNCFLKGEGKIKFIAKAYKGLVSLMDECHPPTHKNLRKKTPLHIRVGTRVHVFTSPHTIHTYNYVPHFFANFFKN